MTKSEIDMESLLRLQITVLILGEAKYYGWWKCEFLSQVGLRFAERIYPRDYFWAAVRSSTIAARTVHDKAIGVSEHAFHLLRLPQDLESALRSVEQAHRAKLVADILPFLDKRAALLDLLQPMATDQRKVQPGPLRLGEQRDLYTAATLGKLVTAYLLAFQNNVQVFPYFARMT